MELSWKLHERMRPKFFRTPHFKATRKRLEIIASTAGRHFKPLAGGRPADTNRRCRPRGGQLERPRRAILAARYHHSVRTMTDSIFPTPFVKAEITAIPAEADPSPPMISQNHFYIASKTLHAHRRQRRTAVKFSFGAVGRRLPWPPFGNSKSWVTGTSAGQ